MGRHVLLVLVALPVLAVATLVACTTRVASDPKTFEVRDDAVPRMRGQQSVALANAYVTPMIVVVGRQGQSKTEADLREFTSTAIGMLERRMKKDGATMDRGASKRVTLRVKDVSVLFDGFAALSTITMEAELGNSTNRSLRIKNNSTSAGRALDGALVKGVTQLLNDEQFRHYINAP